MAPVGNSCHSGSVSSEDFSKDAVSTQENTPKEGQKTETTCPDCQKVRDKLPRYMDDKTKEKFLCNRCQGITEDHSNHHWAVGPLDKFMSSNKAHFGRKVRHIG